MKVIIRSAAEAEGGGTKEQILYAEMGRAEFDKIVEITEDPANADDALVIPSRTEPDGPVTDWTFRVGRTRLEAAPGPWDRLDH
jgi:hypothetical protein